MGCGFGNDPRNGREEPLFSTRAGILCTKEMPALGVVRIELRSVESRKKYKILQMLLTPWFAAVAHHESYHRYIPN